MLGLVDAGDWVLESSVADYGDQILSGLFRVELFCGRAVDFGQLVQARRDWEEDGDFHEFGSGGHVVLGNNAGGDL